MVSPPEEVVLKEAIDAYNNIIIIDSNSWNIIPYELKYMTSLYKVMCGCECSISTKIMHSSLLSWRERFLKNLRIKVVMRKTEGLVKWKIFYLIHIKIMSRHMVSICFKQYLIWRGQQFVHIHHKIMRHHIRNVSCVVVCNVHGLIIQVQNQISTIQHLSPEYVFVCINTLHVLLCISDSLWMKINSANCVSRLHIQL